MNMIEVNTAELSGAALDWAVGKIEALPIEFCESDVDEERHYCYFSKSAFDSRGVKLFCSGSMWFPSKDWNQCGQLIDRFRVNIMTCVNGTWMAKIWEEGRQICMTRHESSPLIAACRAICAAKLGDTAQVPAELLP